MMSYVFPTVVSVSVKNSKAFLFAYWWYLLGKMDDEVWPEDDLALLSFYARPRWGRYPDR